MKEVDNTDNYNEREWQDLASSLSDEKYDNTDLLSRFAIDDRYNTIKYWKELREMNNEKEIDVDKAWNNLYSRLSENGLLNDKPLIRRNFFRTTYFRIAASVILLIGLGTVMFLNEPDILSQRTIVATSDNQKNLQVTLPDGSIVVLNRDTRLVYRNNFGKRGRNVDLRGEAFFEITPDADNPFVIKTGDARIKVIGTSFNVITENPEQEVEVFVKTGKVLLSDNEGVNTIVLDPGYVGTLNKETSDKYVNDDPNYMAWNNGVLIYNGQTLDVVFRDLKKVYNMNIVADEPEILENNWTTNGPLDNQSQETIIRIICTSFNLGYSKVGNVYHLSIK